MKRAFFGTVLILCPAVARACSVCFSATEQNRIAFLVTTIVLSLLPLGLIGGGLLWLRRQARQQDEEAGEIARREVGLVETSTRQAALADAVESA